MKIVTVIVNLDQGAEIRRYFLTLLFYENIISNRSNLCKTKYHCYLLIDLI